MRPFRLTCVVVLLAAFGGLAAPSVVSPAEAVVGVSTVTYDACGAEPLKADGTLWRCTFADNFSGTALDRTKWTPHTAFVSGTTQVHACYRDDPANVGVRYGHLYLRLVKLAAPAPCGLPGLSPTRYQSGSVTTWHKFSQQYGRFEARTKNTATSYPGLHEAFWMWPDERYGATSPWPSSGEIDVAETFSVHPGVSVSALHYSADLAGMQQGLNMDVCAARRGVWNTFRLEWSPTRIEFFVNGRSCLVNTSGDQAFQKRYILNFTQAIGPEDMGNMPVAQTPMPATYQVDYVRVWE
jgi:beta-glucanase (GH16 family)